MEQAHRAAAAAEADRDAAIHRARAEADRRVAAAEADRDQARQLADGAAGQARQAQQKAARAQAGAGHYRGPYAPDHPTVATRLNNLALVLRDLGESARTRPLQERALAIDEAADGPDHPTVATRLNNLALVLRDHGRA